MSFEWAKPVATELLIIRGSRPFAGHGRRFGTLTTHSRRAMFLEDELLPLASQIATFNPLKPYKFSGQKSPRQTKNSKKEKMEVIPLRKYSKTFHSTAFVAQIAQKEKV